MNEGLSTSNSISIGSHLFAQLPYLRWPFHLSVDFVVPVNKDQRANFVPRQEITVVLAGRTLLESDIGSVLNPAPGRVRPTGNRTLFRNGVLSLRPLTPARNQIEKKDTTATKNLKPTGRRDYSAQPEAIPTKKKQDRKSSDITTLRLFRRLIANPLLPFFFVQPGAVLAHCRSKDVGETRNRTRNVG